MLAFLRRHQTTVIAGCVAGGALLAGGLIAYATLGGDPQPQVDPIAEARTLLADDQPAAALAMLRQANADEAESPDEVIALKVAANAAQKNVFELAALYDVHPETVADNDEAAQIVARSALFAEQSTTVDELHQAWADRSESPNAWLCVEADRHLRDGEFDEARKVLESQSFDGDRDGGRQLRLAMLDAAADPEVALERIDAFLLTAPRHGDGHLMRAQLLEGLERLPDARVAYVTALAAMPENPFYRYELASFYRRRGNLEFALRTWQESLELATPAPGYLKVQFWSRVAHPAPNVLEPDESTLTGRLGELALYLADLPDGAFFDEKTFEMLPASRAIARRHQEVYWLRILEALRTGDEQKAADLLRQNSFSEQSWNVMLRESLISLLRFRAGESLRMRTPMAFGGRGPESVHPFIAALQPADGAEPSEEFAAFLRSDNAIAMTALACGWMEAALRLPHDSVCPDAAPHHMAYAMSQASRSNRTADEAFAFAKRQPESPALDSLLGEMLLARGDEVGAMQMWRIAAADAGPAGYRASWMLGVELLARQRLDEARRIVTAHDELNRSTIGQELLARIALARGDVDVAIRIYDGIRNESIDARLFAVRRRLARARPEDIAEARAISEQLFAVHPDVPSVRRLLLQINDLERAQASDRQRL